MTVRWIAWTGLVLVSAALSCDDSAGGGSVDSGASTDGAGRGPEDEAGVGSDGADAEIDLDATPTDAEVDRDGGGCAADDDCAPDQYCENRLCQVGCRVAPDSCVEKDGRALACDLETRQCVEVTVCCGPGDACLETAGSCSAGAVARRDLKRCSDGCDTPVECAADVDCPPGQRCDDGACVDPCARCTDDQICEAGACVDDPRCDADGDCAQGQYCDDLVGRCLDGCRDDADCARESVCVNNACVDCGDAVDCGPGSVCDNLGRCRDGCLDDEDCPAGPCRDGVCTCADDAACGIGRVCEQQGCQDGCRGRAGCPEGQICADGQCGPCGASDDCLDGEFCDLHGACRPGCRSPIECPDGLVCREGVCGVCAANDDCPDGQVCGANGACRPACDVAACPESDTPCQTPVCGEDGCGFEIVFDGTPCPDGDRCNGDEVCEAGACVPGAPPDCRADGCNDARCDAALGCQLVPRPDGTDCGNGDPCDGEEVCRGGSCTTGAPLFCEGDACNTGFCEPGVGCTSRPVADGSPCDDDTVCNGRETCFVGTCQPNPPPACDLGDACNTAVCDPIAGCQRVPLEDGTACDDRNLCNGREVCAGGVCQPGEPLACTGGDACNVAFCSPARGCVVESYGDGTRCDDADFCNGRETCLDGVCRPGAPPVCPGDACNSGACDPARGCVLEPFDDGTSCADDNVCNGEEHCLGGVCQRGENPLCEGADACNDVECDPDQGCRIVPRPDGTSCGDGDACNGAETCRAGVCEPGPPPICAGGDACNTPVCDPTFGCLLAPREDGTACDDETICNGREVCQAGVCQPGEALACAGGDLCNEAVCDPVAGCQIVPLPDGTGCVDGDVCNGQETCRAGVCTPGAPPVCGGNACNEGFCDPTLGCQTRPRDDGTACDDGTVCNGREVCQGGACQPGAPPNCGGGDACREAVCDPVQGCGLRARPNGTRCNDDGNVCNGVNECRDGACQPAAGPLNCTTNNPCQEAFCDPAGGCGTRNRPNGLSCNDDGNVCNGVNECRDGTCRQTAGPLSCGNSDQCMQRGCDARNGCFENAINNNQVCNDDGNVCNGINRCSNGSCRAAEGPLNCGADDVCNTRGCDARNGCFVNQRPNGTSCNDDGNVCNGVNQCVNGGCQQVAGPLNCGGSDFCMQRGCDARGGCFQNPVNNGVRCNGNPPGPDDGNACNGVSQCGNGTCNQVRAPEPEPHLWPGRTVGGDYNQQEGNAQGLRFDCGAGRVERLNFCMPTPGEVTIDLGSRVNGDGCGDARASCLRTPNQRVCQQHEQVCVMEKQAWHGDNNVFAGCSNETRPTGEQPADCNGDINPGVANIVRFLNDGPQTLILRQKCDDAIENSGGPSCNCVNGVTESMRLRRFRVRR